MATNVLETVFINALGHEERDGEVQKNDNDNGTMRTSR